MALDRSGVIDRVHKLVDAPMTYEGLKEKADTFLEAVDTAEEKSTFRALIEEIKSDVLTIDQLISFTESPEGVSVFGEKKACGEEGEGTGRNDLYMSCMSSMQGNSRKSSGDRFIKWRNGKELLHECFRVTAFLVRK